jgi:hypothetical protein
MAVVSIPDGRWARRDIKTVQLLYPSMGKMMAKSQGADDAWMVEDGVVTEGTSNNAYIVRGDTIVTRHLGPEILSGITREAVLRMARESQMRVEERPFTLEEAHMADEAFVTSATTFVMPVVRLDGKPIGPAAPAPSPPACARSTSAKPAAPRSEAGSRHAAQFLGFLPRLQRPGLEQLVQKPIEADRLRLGAGAGRQKGDEGTQEHGRGTSGRRRAYCNCLFLATKSVPAIVVQHTGSACTAFVRDMTGRSRTAQLLSVPAHPPARP